MHKIYFKAFFKHLENFEMFFSLKSIDTITMYEVKSATIESLSEDIWLFEAYLPHDSNINELSLQLIKYAADTEIIIIDDEVKSEKINDQDWVAAYVSSLTPIEVENFFIGARVHSHLCPVNKIGIFIDASRAFGTGDHATTNGCIRSLIALKNQQFNTIFDLGTGSGILSFVAERLWPNSLVYGCDIDKTAVDIAIDNGLFNQSKVQFFQNIPENLTHDILVEKKFDLIISNILSGPLIEYAEEIEQLCQKPAYIVLSGFLENQLASMLEAYEKIGFSRENIIVQDTWVSLTLKLA